LWDSDSPRIFRAAALKTSPSTLALLSDDRYASVLVSLRRMFLRPITILTLLLYPAPNDAPLRNEYIQPEEGRAKRAIRNIPVIVVHI
jgi:hypothetical protein